MTSHGKSCFYYVTKLSNTQRYFISPHAAFFSPKHCPTVTPWVSDIQKYPKLSCPQNCESTVCAFSSCSAGLLCINTILTTGVTPVRCCCCVLLHQRFPVCVNYTQRLLLSALSMWGQAFGGAWLPSCKICKFYLEFFINCFCDCMSLDLYGLVFLHYNL